MSYLRTYKLSELYEISSGISTKSSQSGHGYPFCSFSTIFNNPILPDVLPDLMDASKIDRETYSIKEGDVLLTRTSETLDELAMTSVALKDYPDATFSGFAKRLRPITNKVYPKFMAFFFRSEYFRKIINNKAVMTLRASFNEDIFYDISFELPPLDDQIKAGDFLYDIELKIRNNNLLASEFKNLSDLIFDFWFINYEYPINGKRYKSNGGKLNWNEKINSFIPDEWKVLRVKDLVKNEIGGDWGKENYIGNYTQEVACIRGTDIPFILGGEKSNLEIRFILEKNKNKILRSGDYIIEVSGTPGRSTYINECLVKRYRKPIIASNFCYAFSFKNKELMYWFDSIWKKLYESGTTKGFSGKTTIANLLFDSLAESVYVAVPPIDLIKKYNEIVEPMYEKIQNLYDENQRLNDLRNFLINYFMTGQVTIKQVENKVDKIAKKNVTVTSKNDLRFELWLQQQGLAARGDIDKKTLKEIFDAMDDDDK